MVSALLILGSWFAPTAHADVAALLKQGRITPLQPKPATDFALPDLGGTEHTLGEFNGNWVLLTFWATWCGPCKSEMPSLTKLHHARSERGFQIVAISTDRDLATVKRFTSRRDLGFMVLHDARGEVSQRYRATAIPVSYLIDPAGQLVGVARGARDWSALLGMVDGLLEEGPADPTARPKRAAPALSDAPVEMAPDITPPAAVVALKGLHDGVARPGESFVLDVAVTWAGTLRDYLLLPPKVHLPEGIRQQETSATTSSNYGRHQVRYEVELIADEPGEFSLDPVELRYTPHFEGEPMTHRLAGPVVSVAPRRPLWPFVLGGLAALTALGGGAALFLRTRRSEPEAATDPLRTLRDAFARARERRVAGDAAGFLAAVIPILEELGQSEPALAEALERARFGGQLPSAQELDRLERRIERELTAKQQLAQSDPLKGIQLANEDEGKE